MAKRKVAVESSLEAGATTMRRAAARVAAAFTADSCAVVAVSPCAADAAHGPRTTTSALMDSNAWTAAAPLMA
ncbi:hypothetical protein DWQ67_08150 [Galactobacter caseinivorans]|uniref:Uncharacterized protein n=1 Tax=Galactobacter caseinivorans TaxID=2676123 RepID=A0A496PIX0_9MICC|nr:hypothetical protein DWQ67_08150 [Galactobacter caseinivorans]